MDEILRWLRFRELEEWEAAANIFEMLMEEHEGWAEPINKVILCS
eukprot:SAG11_NODE_1120_length_5789_cov_12.068190_2_plen_45_part_00